MDEAGAREDAAQQLDVERVVVRTVDEAGPGRKAAQGVELGARYAEVRYEDLITRPEAALRHVLAFLGESYEPRLMMGMSNLEPDGEGLSEADAAMVQELAGGVLRELRYR